VATSYSPMLTTAVSATSSSEYVCCRTASFTRSRRGRGRGRCLSTLKSQRNANDK
jgi:hypothetical protein